jgi:7-carboxy-7-deazaguanine synthase
MFSPVSDTLIINEVFLSLQGESSFAGLPCIFVRLTGCNLRCSYCDTAYALAQGRSWTLAEVSAEIDRLAKPYRAAQSPWRLPLVELTGGEPLLQSNSLALMKALCDSSFTVLLETNGALDISPVDPRVHRIMDLKCLSSGEVSRNRWENLRHLQSTDQLKFVIASAQDYEWAREAISQRRLASLCPLLFSWAGPLEPHQRIASLKPIPAGHTPLSRQQLAERIIADALPVRFQLQAHKFIWPPDRRGV